MSERSWYEIRAAAADGDPVEIFIFEEIGFWGVTAKQFIDELRGLGDVAGLTVHINSPGGDVFDGLAIYNVLNRVAAPVVVRVDGLAASAASIIAMAGDEVIMPENALMMVHHPWGLSIGNAEEMEAFADTLRKISGSLVSVYRAKTGLDDDRIVALLDAETWMSAAEAAELGFADTVEPAVEIAAQFDLTRFRHPPEIQSKKGRKMSKETKASASVDPAPESKSTEQPDLDAIRAEAAANAVRDEQARVAGILAHAKHAPGHDDLVQAMIADPAVSADAAAGRLLAAQAEKGAAQLAGLKGDLPGAAEAAQPAAPAASDGAAAKADLSGLPIEEQAKRAWETDAALQAEFGDFRRYAAFRKAHAAGRIRYQGNELRA